MPRRRKRMIPKEPTPHATEPANEQDRTIIWTHCPKCGDICTTRVVAPKGRCPVCHGKVKTQKVVF